MSLRGAQALDHICGTAKTDADKASGRASRFAPPPRTSPDLGSERENRSLSRSSSARTLSSRPAFNANAREPNAITRPTSLSRAASSSRERSRTDRIAPASPPQRAPSRGTGGASPSQRDARQRRHCSPQRGSTQQGRTPPVEAGRALEDAGSSVRAVHTTPPSGESPIRQRRGKHSVQKASQSKQADAASDTAIDPTDPNVLVRGGIDTGSGAATQEIQPVAPPSEFQSSFTSPGLGGCEPVGRNLREECEQLRQALADTTERVEQTMREVAEQQSQMQHRQDRQQAEAVSLLEELRVLSSENKKLQVGARDSRNAAWKLQAAVKAREDSVELTVVEETERQKRLEQDNARLRKEAAALKARVLGWRRAQQRNRSPGPQRPAVLKSKQQAPVAESVENGAKSLWAA